MPGKVLIIDDLATNRIILKVKLSAAYYEVSQAASVDEARVLLARSRPDLILLGVRLADDTTLTQTIRQLQKTQAEAPAIPVVVLLDSDNANDRVLALRAGAEQVLSRPLDEQMLLARLRNLMRQLLTDQDLHHHTLTAHAMGFAEQQQGFAPPGQIGLIAQGKQTTRKLQMRLAAHVPHSLRMMSAEDIMGAAASSAEQPPALVPDMFVMQMGDGDQQDGLRLLSELRADPGTRNCPVIAVLPRDAAAMAAQLLDLGASDVVFSDTDPQEIALRLGKQLDLKRSRDRLRDRLQDGLQAAVIDQLTGLYNRRYALSYLNCLMEARDTTTSSFAVMVADLDYFKQVNDTYGHAAGDAVLARVAKLLSSHLRRGISDHRARHHAGTGPQDRHRTMPARARHAHRAARPDGSGTCHHQHRADSWQRHQFRGRGHAGTGRPCPLPFQGRGARYGAMQHPQRGLGANHLRSRRRSSPCCNRSAKSVRSSALMFSSRSSNSPCP